ncbi:alkaline phosphatase [Candidatus Francisella endociliophora]|uniref:adenosine deaminase n=1 Tax=Candidatus Francisella endociliophora TaxID=653937 RepID=A0A097EMS6_9GAMM|nr:alkaline phosphatase [Francisella sp. FSC1006]AIT08865.1 alkaline phosphatase [Francisella sp. FSC1006]
MLKKDILSIPKVVLHDHLDGGLRSQTIIELADNYNISLPEKNSQKLLEWFSEEFSSKDFDKCFDSFNVACSVMQTVEAIERVAFEFAEDHALENVIYVEARFCPFFHREKGLSYDQIIESIAKGFSRAKQKYDIETGILVCGMYHFTDDTNLELAKLCLKHNEIVGYDFAGMDLNGSVSTAHPKTISFLQENNIDFTIHSGEFSNIQNIKDSILTGAKRIGHACNLYKTVDNDLLREVVGLLIDKNVHIESNVSSNLALGIVDSFENHPYQRMFGDNINVALNTDDRLMLNNISITDEYYSAHLKNNLSFSSMVIMNLNAAKAAFIKGDKKEKIVTKVKAFAESEIL